VSQGNKGDERGTYLSDNNRGRGSKWKVGFGRVCGNADVARFVAKVLRVEIGSAKNDNLIKKTTSYLNT